MAASSNARRLRGAGASNANSHHNSLLYGTCRYANITSHIAAPSTSSTATTQEAEKRCSISEARRRKRARAETSTTATAPSMVASS